MKLMQVRGELTYPLPRQRCESHSEDLGRYDYIKRIIVSMPKVAAPYQKYSNLRMTALILGRMVFSSAPIVTLQRSATSKSHFLRSATYIQDFIPAE